MSNPATVDPRDIEGRKFRPLVLQGGADQETSKFGVNPSTLQDVLNYNSSTKGYQRAEGLFHFDGTIDGAVTNLWVVAVDDNEATVTGTGFTLGGAVTWGDSSSGVVVYYDRVSGTPDYTYLGITEILGTEPSDTVTYTDTESGTTLVPTGGSFTYPPSELITAVNPSTGVAIADTITKYLALLNDTVNAELAGQTSSTATTYHGMVPGVGRISGGWQYEDEIYVIRDGYALDFDNGRTEFKPGDEVNIRLTGGGVEVATVAYVELTSGYWSNWTATGRLVLMPSSSTADFRSLDDIDDTGKVYTGPTMTSTVMATIDSHAAQYGGLIWKGTVHGWEWVDAGWTLEYSTGTNAPNVKAAPLFIDDLIDATRSTGSTAVAAAAIEGSLPNITWTNKDNILTDNATNATSALGSGETTMYLKAQIPASIIPHDDVRVVGVEVSINAEFSGTAAPIDSVVRLVNEATDANFYLSDNRARRESLGGTATITASTISAWGPTNTYLDSASGFVAAGFVVGQSATVTGFTGNVANNITNGIITKVTNTGGDIAVNGTFTGDTDWTKGTGWTIPATDAQSDGSQAADSDLVNTGIVVEAGETYLVTYTVSAWTAGNVTAVVGATEGTDRGSAATFVESITATDTTPLTLRADVDFIGTVDNISIAKSGNITIGGTDGDVIVSEDSGDSVTIIGHNYYVYGSSTDSWGNVDISAEDINNGDVHVLIQYFDETGLTGTAEVDYVSVDISYVPNNEKVWFWDGTTDVSTGVINSFQIESGDFGVPNDAAGNMSFTSLSAPEDIGVGMSMYSEPAGAGLLVANVTNTPSYNLLPASDELIAEGSQFQVITANYYENDESEAVYGVTGAGPAFSYDGTSFSYLRAPLSASVDKPRHIAFHDNRLALGYPTGHVILSSIGVPNDFSAVNSASSWGVGDRVTGLISLAGTVLGVFSESSIRSLEGSDSSSGTMRTISSTTGCREYTLQNITGPYFADNRGISSLTASDKYGDFDMGRISDPVRTWIQTRMQERRTVQTLDTSPVASVAIRNKNEYRLYFRDGYVLVMYFRANGAVEPSFMHYDTVAFGTNYVPTFINSHILSNGRERVVKGTENGDVWIVDGANVIQDIGSVTKPDCFLINNPINFGQPQGVHKHYHVVLQGQFFGAQAMDTWADSNYTFDETGPANDSIVFGDYSDTPLFESRSEVDSTYLPMLADGFSMKIQTTMDGSAPHTLQSLLFRASSKGIDRNRTPKAY